MNFSFIAADSFDDVGAAISDLIRQMWTPLLAIFGALTMIWAFYIAWKFWHAGGDEQKKRAAKESLSNFVLGILILFGIVVAAPMLISAFVVWISSYV